MDSEMNENTENLQPEEETTPGHEAAAGEVTRETEADVLRSELQQAQEQIEALRSSVDDVRDKFMRSRAELEHYRRRSAAELERARASGLDSAVSAVLRVFDDLGRAISMADEAADNSREAIVDGIRLVQDNLEKELGQLGVERYGADGDQFDPELYEAVTAVPASDESLKGTVAQVVQAGFRQGERLDRKSTRLNSSHVRISYAVFCLKKK